MNPQPVTLDALRTHAATINYPATGVEVYHINYDTKAPTDRQRLIRHYWFTASAPTLAGVTLTHVATIPTTQETRRNADLEEALRRTNNSESQWDERPGLLDISPGPHRSTSVGDVLLRRATGELFVVLTIGFLKMPGL